MSTTTTRWTVIMMVLETLVTTALFSTTLDRYGFENISTKFLKIARQGV